MNFNEIKQVDSFAKNSLEEIRVSISEGNNRPLVSMWVFYRAADGEYKPGKSGLCFDIGRLPRFLVSIDKLKSVVEELRATGQLPPAEPPEDDGEDDEATVG